MGDESDNLIISIHPPRAGWDGVEAAAFEIKEISIHPPRAGWDVMPRMTKFLVTKFQSTHPVRGGTTEMGITGTTAEISIHPPRAGWDML